MRYYFIKGDVGLRVSDSIRKNFEDVSLDMMTVEKEEAHVWSEQQLPT